MNRRFVITCHGWSGSNWLAHVLNRHPDVVCTHSARCILPGDPEMNSDDELKKNLPTLHAGYVSRAERSLNEVYLGIEKLGTARAYGSVHYYRMRDLPLQAERFHDWSGPIPVVNVVRNPVAVLLSGAGHFKTLFTYDLNELSWSLNRFLNTNDDRWRSLVADTGLEPGRIEHLSFLCACSVAESLYKDALVDPGSLDESLYEFKGHRRIEELFPVEEAFRDLIGDVANEVRVSESYLNECREVGTINAHARGHSSASLEERFEQLESWQKDTLIYYLERYELIEFYESLGYSLDFLRSS